MIANIEEEFTFETNNKSTGEAQSANYLKSRTDYTTQCQLGNAKQETTNSILHRTIEEQSASNWFTL
jgi:hypothetical protein